MCATTNPTDPRRPPCRAVLALCGDVSPRGVGATCPRAPSRDATRPVIGADAAPRVLGQAASSRHQDHDDHRDDHHDKRDDEGQILPRHPIRLEARRRPPRIVRVLMVVPTLHTVRGARSQGRGRACRRACRAAPGQLPPWSRASARRFASAACCAQRHPARQRQTPNYPHSAEARPSPRSRPAAPRAQGEARLPRLSWSV